MIRRCLWRPRGVVDGNQAPTPPPDPIALAKLIGDIATGQVVDAVDDGKDAAAAEMGRKGAAARSQSVSPERRAAIAKKAAAKRWNKG